MFAIYNNGSVDFRSNSDSLYELKDVGNVQSTNLNPDDGFVEYFAKANKNNKKPDTSGIDTYKKMANIDTSEMIFQVKDIMTKNCIYIDTQSTIKDAYDVLNEFKIEQMPIVTFGKKILGIIDKKMILNLLMEDLENPQHVLNRKIADIYLPQLLTADPSTDIRRLANVMIDFKLHAVPIVGTNDILVGIVSKTDIIKAVSHIPHFQLWS